jgi:hypothetical protein
MTTEYIQGELVYHCHDLSPNFKEVIVVPIGDVHYGNPMFSKHHLIRAINFVGAAPNRKTILTGDLAECVIKTSKGDLSTQKHRVQEQYEYIRDIFMPIRGHILGITQGNHEWRIDDVAQMDLCDMWSKDWGCPYGKEELLTKISFGSGNARMRDAHYSYFIYATHGYGGARTKGAKNVKVERSSHQVHADVYIMSHDHDASIQEGSYLIPHTRTYTDKATGFKVGSMVSTDKKLVKTNAYLKRGGYAARAGYDPVTLNLIEIKLKGEGKPHVRVEM